MSELAVGTWIWRGQCRGKIGRWIDGPTQARARRGMKVKVISDTQLVVVDTRLDKKPGIGAMSVLLLFMACQVAEADDWVIAAIPLALVIALPVYLWLSHVRSELTFDKPGDKGTLVVRSRRGRETWDWA